MGLDKKIPLDERIIERRKDNGVWEDIKFKELTKGNVFRMFDDNNKQIPVKTLAGQTIFRATGGVTMGENDVPQIMMEALDTKIFLGGA